MQVIIPLLALVAIFYPTYQYGRIGFIPQQCTNSYGP